MFALFVNDFEEFLISNDCKGVDIYFDEQLDAYFTILVLLYADDTVLISKTAQGLQKSLDYLHSYACMWNLTVNKSKTKIVVFGKRLRNQDYVFTYDGDILEIVDSYKYLGILFSANGNFHKCKVNLKEQAERAMFALLNKCNTLDLPLDVQLDLFDKTILPIMIYGCEVWGYENVKILELIQLRFCKYILKVKKSTPNVMVYGELGVYSIEIAIKVRMISFWLKLACDVNRNKLAVKLYNFLKYLHDNNLIKMKWFDFIKNILDQCGLSCYWNDINDVNTKWLVETVKMIFKGPI